MQQHTDAQVDIDVVWMGNLWEEFASGAYDFAFSPGLPFAGTVRVEAVYVDPVVFFASPAHPLARRVTVAFDELRKEQLVGKFSDPYWMRIQRDLEERGYAFSQSIDLSSAEAVKRIVLSGVGVGVLFESAVLAELGREELVALPVGEQDYEQPYFIVRPEIESTPQAERLCAFLREELTRVRRA